MKMPTSIQKKVLLDWLKGTKRTCRCGKGPFATRKDLRIHRKTAHRRYI